MAKRRGPWNECFGKTPIATRAAARRAARFLRYQCGETTYPYVCHTCHQYHLASAKETGPWRGRRKDPSGREDSPDDC